MTKEQLRTEYITKGWTVQEVADWRKVSDVEGVEKYDVNVVSPDNRFGTAQVVVRSDEAVADGLLKDKEDSFTDRLRTFVRTLEAGTVFAVSLGDVSDEDCVGIANVYFTDGTKKTFVVKERNNTFTYKQLI